MLIEILLNTLLFTALAKQLAKVKAAVAKDSKDGRRK